MRTAGKLAGRIYICRKTLNRLKWELQFLDSPRGYHSSDWFAMGLTKTILFLMLTAFLLMQVNESFAELDEMSSIWDMMSKSLF